MQSVQSHGLRGVPASWMQVSNTLVYWSLYGKNRNTLEESIQLGTSVYSSLSHCLIMSYRDVPKQLQQSMTMLFKVWRRYIAKHTEMDYLQAFIKSISMGKGSSSKSSRGTTAIKAAKAELSSKPVCVTWSSIVPLLLAGLCVTWGYPKHARQLSQTPDFEQPGLPLPPAGCTVTGPGLSCSRTSPGDGMQHSMEHLGLLAPRRSSCSMFSSRQMAMNIVLAHPKAMRDCSLEHSWVLFQSFTLFVPSHCSSWAAD